MPQSQWHGGGGLLLLEEWGRKPKSKPAMQIPHCLHTVLTAAAATGEPHKPVLL